MKALVLLAMVVTLVVFEALARPLGLSTATATAVWVACSLFVSKPMLVMPLR